MGAPTTDGFISKGHRTDALHTLSLLAPHVRPGDSVLDVGCGYGYVLDQLGRRERVECMGIDIVDQRAVADHPFALWDGRTIPFEDGRFDVVMLNFVLHHVPNGLKRDVLAAARRVCRRAIFVLEDTPRNFVDRWFNRRHGEAYRRKIGSDASYGFFSRPEWEAVFAELGLLLRVSRRLGRFCRNWDEPHARSLFVLERGRATG